MSGELANTGKILIYQNEKGDTKIDVYFEEDTIWMTQKAMVSHCVPLGCWRSPAAHPPETEIGRAHV